MTLDKEIVDQIIAGNGFYPGDEHLPPVDLVIEYDNAWGGTSYGCVKEGKPNQYQPSSHVQNPRVYWRRDTRPANE